ncbi:hypothetical protein BHE74_00050745, partial [Ensete ventricosum]
WEMAGMAGGDEEEELQWPTEEEAAEGEEAVAARMVGWLRRGDEKGWQRWPMAAAEEGWQRLCDNGEGCEWWLCVAEENNDGQWEEAAGVSTAATEEMGVW